MARFARKVDGAWLARQLVIRDLTPTKVSKEGGIGSATVSRALASQAVTPASMAAITRVLNKHKPQAGVELLIGKEG